MKKDILKNISKTILLSFILVSVFNLGSIVIEASENANNNSTNFKKLESSDISKTGVAITINLATRHSQNKIVSDAIFKKIYTAKEILENIEIAKEELILKDMLFTKEYFSILKTDFRDLIKSSSDTSKTLEDISSQLKMRHTIGIKQIENIENQKKVLIKAMNEIEKEIKDIKQKINIDFQKANSKEVNSDIDKYLELKHNFYTLRMFVVFEKKFLNYYKIMNKYNKNFIEALTLNKDIITKGSYLVIPNSGKKILKDYGLLYSEIEFTNKIKNTKKEELKQ